MNTTTNTTNNYLPADIANYTLEELVELILQAIAKGAK